MKTTFDFWIEDNDGSGDCILIKKDKKSNEFYFVLSMNQYIEGGIEISREEAVKLRNWLNNNLSDDDLLPF